jgi:hypothetical protein
MKLKLQMSQQYPRFISLHVVIVVFAVSHLVICFVDVGSVMKCVVVVHKNYLFDWYRIVVCEERVFLAKVQI